MKTASVHLTVDNNISRKNTFRCQVKYLDEKQSIDYFVRRVYQCKMVSLSQDVTNNSLWSSMHITEKYF